MRIKIDKIEVLRYLGYRGEAVSDDIGQMIDGCIDAVENAIVPRAVFKIFEADEIKLRGLDIKEHLKGCDKYVLMAATLGAQMDAMIRKAQALDMSKAVILDACGSGGIENICDQLTDSIQKEWQEKHKHVTGRFSPGYGDMPVSQQKELCRMLDAERKIGLCVSENGTMVPGKSVTAIMGISKKSLPARQRSCNICNMRKTCEYRKVGKSHGECGN